jgi:hypothetical protein
MYKYSEDKLLKEIQNYIDSTYTEHYANGLDGIQTTEFIIDNGDGIGFTRGNVIKYAQRYGKKGGYNRKDILKIIHYAIILLHVHDLEREKVDSFEQLSLKFGDAQFNATIERMKNEYYPSNLRMEISDDPK